MTLKHHGLGAARSKSWVGVAVALLVLMGVAVLALHAGRKLRVASREASSPVLTPASKPTAQTTRLAYAHLPLIFEPNQGQTDQQVKFLARGHGYGLFLTAGEAVLSLHSPSGKTSVVKMALEGASGNPVVSGLQQLPGKSNYFIGQDASQWHTNIPQYAQVNYRDVYPGINLVYYGKQGSLEYDFEVAPQADPKQIALRFSGSDHLKMDSSGDLLLKANEGHVRLQAPRVYQRFGEEERPVSGHFVMLAQNEVGFALGDYDHSRTLVIDPVLTYLSYLGGSGNEACSVINGTSIPVSGCPAIAVDSAFNIYVAGSTSSADFPPQPGVLGSLTGAANVFVTKFDVTGTVVLFSTYLGGTGTDTTAGVSVDTASNVYVAGTTTSTDFPVLNPFQANALSAGKHVFVTKLSGSAFTPLYSTYLSGTGVDICTGIALDFRSKAYVTGTTTSTDFPTTVNAFQTTSKAANQFFMTALDPSLAGVPSVFYSTYIGGSTPLGGMTLGGGIAADTSATPNVYVTGGTDFSDMPILNSFQPYNAGDLVDVWVAKFSFPQTISQLPTLQYLTYLGGSGNDIANGIAVDTVSAYITGSTSSLNFPAATNVTPLQPANGGGASDAFLAKLGTPCTGSTCTTTTVPLNYFTYLGGGGTDVGLGVAVDTVQGARVTGSTTGSFPTLNFPFQSSYGGGTTDGFVARVDTTATSATSTGHYESYLGGSGTDAGTSIVADNRGNAYVAGETSSANLAVTNPFQASLDPPTDAFFATIGPKVNLSITATASPSPVGVGNPVAFRYVITNNGDLTSGVTFQSTLPTVGVSFGSATTSPGSCSGATNGSVVCNIGTLNAGATATVTITLTPTLQGTLTNSGQVTAFGSSVVASASASATANDFAITITPASVTVPAGLTASYQININTVPPNSAFPESVALSFTSTKPTGTTTTFTTQTIPNLNNGSASSVLNIATTARTTTTASSGTLGRPFYAGWLPVSGLVFLGLGIGGAMPRRRRWLAGLMLAMVFSLVGFQAACGGNSTGTTVTTGTPAGSYTFTITATSGSRTQSATSILVVQ